MILPRTPASILRLLRLPGSPPRIFISAFSFHSSPPVFFSPPLPLGSASYSRRVCCFRQNQQRLFAVRAFSTGAALAAVDKNGADTFFAEDAVSWTSIGVSERLARALTNAGLHRPSLVQDACIPSILSGTDVVVAAETGSGKTHGYLVPLISHMCSRSDESANKDDKEATPGFSLVLCPNVTLCEQVVRMANCLCGDNGEPLLRTASVCGRQGWPINEPDILVSTPAALLNSLNAFDPEKRRRTDFIRGVKFVVFDEADMLLCGSFQNQVIRLIHMLRFDEKLLSRMRRPSLKEPTETDPDFSTHLNSEDGEDLKTGIISDGEEVADVEDSTENSEAGDSKRKHWRRVRKYYERSKQYIFVAATLPVNGKETAGGVLKRMFPGAKWISGNFLHRHNPRLKQKWVEVSIDTQVDALIEAVNDGISSEIPESVGGVSRTMVFANTVSAVEAVATVLQRAGIECLCYHSESSLEERAEILTNFQQNGGVLVCTDAAARGLDIPNVSHVIQAEFAKSAVDFLHRTGRTGRAGQYGLVTSLYSESSTDLVAAVRQAEDLGRPVEDAFSRKRSFRKKLRKRRGLNAVMDASDVEDRVLA